MCIIIYIYIYITIYIYIHVAIIIINIIISTICIYIYYIIYIYIAAFHDSCTSHVSCILHFADNVFHLQISFWKHFEGPIHKLPFGSIPNRAEGRKT